MRRDLRKYMNKNKEPNTGSKLSLLLIGSVFAGFIPGVIWSFLYPEGGYNLVDGINAYLSDFSISPLSQLEIIIDSALKYGKFIVSVWFMAYLPIGVLFVFAILFIKGFSLGFTIGALICVKGLSGALISICLILPQNLVFIPTLVYTGYKSISASLGKEKTRDIKRRVPKRTAEPTGVGYFITLAIGITTVLIISLYEAYAVPVFWNISF